MPVWVAGRQVYVNTQRTQTVKICTRQNTRGIYERYWRIEPPYGIPQRQMELTVSRFGTLSDLEQWLINDRHAQREPQHEARNLSAGEPHVPVSDQSLQQQPVTSIPQEPTGDDDEESAEPEVSGAVAEVLDLLSSARYSPDEDAWL